MRQGHLSRVNFITPTIVIQALSVLMAKC